MHHANEDKLEGTAGVLLSVDDRTVTSRDYANRLEDAANTRHRRMLETLMERDQAEALHDIGSVMATLADEHELVRFWPVRAVTLRGSDAVREFYQNLFARGGIGNVTSQVLRLAIDDDCIVTESLVTTV